MKLKEVINIMNTNHKLDPNKPSGSWAAIIAAPHGLIQTEEQYQYILEYAQNTEVSLDGMKTFEEDKGKCLYLGDYFGGAAFYFTTSTKNIEPWSYGEYGKIEF